MSADSSDAPRFKLIVDWPSPWRSPGLMQCDLDRAKAEFRLDEVELVNLEGPEGYPVVELTGTMQELTNLVTRRLVPDKYSHDAVRDILARAVEIGLEPEPEPAAELKHGDRIVRRSHPGDVATVLSRGVGVLDSSYVCQTDAGAIKIINPSEWEPAPPPPPDFDRMPGDFWVNVYLNEVGHEFGQAVASSELIAASYGRGANLSGARPVGRVRLVPDPGSFVPQSEPRP